MSQQNVEVVIRGIRLFEASDLEEAGRLWHEESWITGPEGWPERGPFEGREAVMGQFRRLAGDWGQQRVSNLEVVADRDGWVVVSFNWEVKGGRSGAATAARFAAAYQLRDGKISCAHFRWAAEEALEAAGLRE